MGILDDDLVKAQIEEFMKNRAVCKRDASYDFCYLYFQRNKGHLADPNMEYSCMQLWSYLASWGMLRGSSPLFWRSPAALKPLILYFDELCNSPIWNIDVDSYTEENIKEILHVYARIVQILQAKEIMDTDPSITLVTKIMLGVFGCVPAVDHYFFKTFHTIYGGFRILGEKELTNLEHFYLAHKETIDNIQVPVLDFDGQTTELIYKKAKLIDMYGFQNSKED